MRCEYLNAAKGMQSEKVGIARHDVSRAAVEGDFEELIVLGITAEGYADFHFDPFSLARQSRQKISNIFLVDVPAKLFST